MRYFTRDAVAQIAAIAYANKNRHCESVIANVVKQHIAMLQKTGSSRFARDDGVG